jgi:hypothetical protein
MSNEWYDIDSWQWVDSEDAQWAFTLFSGYKGLYQIWTDNKYVYAATTSGLDIIEIETELRCSFVSNSSGYSSVWSDNNEIFVGSMTNGITYFNQYSIGPLDMVSFLVPYAKTPFITSNEIKYIHGNLSKLICCTSKGVDIIRRDSNYITHTTISGATKCFVTTNYNYYYYTISGSEYWSLNRLNGNTGDWLVPDIIYTTGSGFLQSSNSINDFYVTEHTSLNGMNNTLFIATDLGAYVYDEGTTDYEFFTISL